MQCVCLFNARFILANFTTELQQSQPKNIRAEGSAAASHSFVLTESTPLSPGHSTLSTVRL